MRMTPTDWALLLLLSILWGGAFFFTAIAVKEIPPLTLVFLRVAIAALTLMIFIRINGKQIPKNPSIWAAFFIMGLLNNLIPFSLLFWAQTSISSGLASIINATMPIFSILVAHFALSDEKLTLNRVIGTILGIIGVVILFGAQALDTNNIATLGMFACLVAALSYGCASVFGRRFTKMGVTPLQTAFGQLTATSLMMLPIIISFDGAAILSLPSEKVIISIIILAVASTAFAYLIFFKLLASAGAVNVALVTLIIPVSAIILGALFLNEQLETRHFTGMTLILSGLVAIDGRFFANFKR